MEIHTNNSIPVLTYHSNNVQENSYSGNDHIALETDLRVIDEYGLRLISLSQLADWLEGRIPFEEVRNGIAITIDDGSWLDFHNVLHPTCGPTTSMFNILQDFRRHAVSDRHRFHISSFVIASPEARVELDKKNLIGKGWWGHDWWKRAQQSGSMSIECHSWDHNHYTLESVAQKNNLNGDFRRIDTYEECVIHTIQANSLIANFSGRKPAFFAYPWGQASEYMLREFMPNHQDRHEYRAAFSIEARHVSRQDDRWFLPRYVCGRDWRSPEELLDLLK